MAKDIEKQRAARRRWYQRNRQHAQQQIKRRKIEMREWLTELKSILKCERCPENHPACLDFHHHEGEKEFSIAAAVKEGYSKERILAEIAKCRVICANCHRKEHWCDETKRFILNDDAA